MPSDGFARQDMARPRGFRFCRVIVCRSLADVSEALESSRGEGWRLAAATRRADGSVDLSLYRSRRALP